MNDYALALGQYWWMWKQYLKMGEPFVAMSIFFDLWLMPVVLLSFLAWYVFPQKGQS